MSNDAIERLRDYAINKWTDGISVKDARDILATFDALQSLADALGSITPRGYWQLIQDHDAARKRAEKAEAELAAAIVALADAQEQIDELRDNEIWRKIYND